MEKKRRNPSRLVAALLSIVPGMGQIYAGYTKRGLTLFFALALQAGILLAVGATGLLAWLALVWLWNIRDADRCAGGLQPSITIPVLILVLVNFSAGWQETQVDLIALKRGIMGNDAKGIVGGLARPDIISSKMKTETAHARYYVDLEPPASAAETTSEGPQISLDRPKMSEGDSSVVDGQGFMPDSRGMLYLVGAADIPLEPLDTDSEGKFSASFRNPYSLPGDYWIEARISTPIGGWEASKTLSLTSQKMLETVFMALMGTVLSLIVTVPLSFLGARNLTSQIPVGAALYSATRTLFNVLRSVEVIIIAIIMAVIVGIGPFAGVLALAIHGVGALGKLYSEAIESIDPGPVEAVSATGASPLQVVIYGVIPQVVPQFVAFTIYRWDINVRMATVIGLVGGGGIGFLLKQYIDLTQWQQAGTAIWLIAAVVMVMDYASAVIRERII